MPEQPEHSNESAKREVKRARLQIVLLTLLGVAIAWTAQFPLASGMDLKWRTTQLVKWAAVYACHHWALRAAWRGGAAG